MSTKTENTPLPDEDVAAGDLLQPSLTIRQFCVREHMSPASYYKMRRLGFGPVELVIPGTEIIRITPKTHREWRAMLEERSRTEAAELERTRRALQRSTAGKTAAASPMHISQRHKPAAPRASGRRG
jgi:hypothetical protein